MKLINKLYSLITKAIMFFIFYKCAEANEKDLKGSDDTITKESKETK